MDVDSFIKRVYNLNAKDLIVEAAGSNTEELADQNVINLDAGLLFTNKKIAPKYETKAYSNFKKSIGSKSSPTPDLKLTGDFHEGIFAKVQSDKIMFGSTDSKEGTLQDKYTGDIFGVTEDQLIEEIDGDIVKLIDAKINTMRRRTAIIKTRRIVSSNLDNIYFTSLNIAKDWDSNAIPLDTLRVIIDKSKPNVNTGDKGVDDFNINYSNTLESLFKACSSVSKKMNSKNIPISQIKLGIDIIKKAFKDGQTINTSETASA